MKTEDTRSQIESLQEIALYKARLSLLTQQGPTGVWAGIVSILLFAYLARELVNTNILLIWVAIHFSGSLGHLTLLHYVGNKLSTEQTQLSLSKLIGLENSLSTSFFIGGLVFGFIGLFIEPDWPVTMLVFVPLLAGGALAGSGTIRIRQP